jgi:predicted hydrolase (HD superfamily)
MRDFHDVAPTGWYGSPQLADVGRAEEIAEEVADHIVRRAYEVWAALEKHVPASLFATPAADGVAMGATL